MGTAHKVVSACLRVLEFCCCAIILGLLARFFYLLDQVDGPKDSRLTYTLSIAAISVAFSMVLIPPLKYSFYCFPIDLALFVCWIVSYVLLQDLSGTSSCSSGWFTSYWTVYHSNSGKASVVTTPGCSQWRAVLGFSFIVAFVWLLSGCLGAYASFTKHDLDVHIMKVVRKLKWWGKPKKGDLENGVGPDKLHSNEPLPKVG